MAAIPDPNLEALVSKAKAVEGRFYIVNTLVTPRDGSRILGPYTQEQLAGQKEKFDSIASRIPEQGRPPFVVYQYTKGEYTRIE